MQIRGHWVVDQYFAQGRSALTDDGWFDTGDVATALLHVAIYAGVPAANHAFKIVKKTYEEMGRNA